MGALSALPSAYYTTPGKPRYQQDRHLLLNDTGVTLHAVFDGHGTPETGHLAAEHCRTHLEALLHSRHLLSSTSSLNTNDAGKALRDAVRELDTSVLAATTAARTYAGTTLCAVLRRDAQLFCANVGDSRALLVSAGGERALSTDHTPAAPAERARVERAGGWVVGGLVNGYISMTRALGDDDMKGHRNRTPFPATGGPPGAGEGGFDESLFTGEPDVSVTRVGAEDLVAVVASDGVWGKLSNEAVGVVVRAEIRKGRTAGEVAKAVVKRALAKGSRDNVTAVVSFLHGGAEVRAQLVGRDVPVPTRARKAESADWLPKGSPVDVREGALGRFGAHRRRMADADKDRDQGSDSGGSLRFRLAKRNSR